MEWSDEGISGRVRFLNRAWRACEPFFGIVDATNVRTPPETHTPQEKALVRAVAVAAKSAVDETTSRRFHYNATIAKLDELVNALTAAVAHNRDAPATRYAAHALPLLLAPFAPFVADELWERFGHGSSVHLERYLEPDERALAVDEITLVVQVNGKSRARIAVAPGLTEEQAYELAMAEQNVRAQFDGKQLRKRIYVPDRLLNLGVG